MHANTVCCHVWIWEPGEHECPSNACRLTPVYSNEKQHAGTRFYQCIRCSTSACGYRFDFLLLEIFISNRHTTHTIVWCGRRNALHRLPDCAQLKFAASTVEWRWLGHFKSNKTAGMHTKTPAVKSWFHLTSAGVIADREGTDGTHQHKTLIQIRKVLLYIVSHSFFRHDPFQVWQNVQPARRQLQLVQSLVYRPLGRGRALNDTQILRQATDSRHDHDSTHDTTHNTTTTRHDQHIRRNWDTIRKV